MSVPVFIALVVGTGLAAVLGRRATRGLRRSARRLSAVSRARREGFSEVRPGPVALRGVVEPIDLVRSGLSGKQGVYVRTTCERWDDLPNTTGVGGKWVVAHRDEQAAPFELSDGHSAVLIDPEGAEFRVPIRPGDSNDPELRYQEAVLVPGTEVVVVGEARHEGGFEPTSTYRGHTIGTVVARGRDGLFIAVPSRLGARLFGSVALSALAVLPVLGLGSATVLYVLSHAPTTTVRCTPAPQASADDDGGCAVGAPEDVQPPATYRRLPWRGPRPRHASQQQQQLGVLSVRVVVPGVASRAVRRSLDERVRRELWRRRLSWLTDVRFSRHREHLIFDVIEIRGRAVRDRAFWASYCSLHRDRCPRLGAQR
ncbi:MAG: hypothetical protein KC503_26920 [Myxococcales bacterium]|nr:hypothetical protein [Myxococcales bacterium]